MTTLDFGQISESISDERTDGHRMAEAVGNYEDIRYCACGCGEPLASTAKWKYIRGHKLKSLSEKDGIKDPDPPKDKNSNHPVFPTGEVPQEIKRDLEDKLKFFLGIAGIGWEAKDPYCGAAFNDRTDQIAEKLVPIICRNPQLLRWFTSAGHFSTLMDLAVVLYPIGKVVVQHHVLKSIGHDEEQEYYPQGDPSLIYPVQ